eukprot:4154003-Pyramimonas_sp.AAC.1
MADLPVPARGWVSPHQARLAAVLCHDPVQVFVGEVSSVGREPRVCVPAARELVMPVARLKDAPARGWEGLPICVHKPGLAV